MTPPLGPKFLTATTTQLAQAFIDDPGKAYRHYGAQPVQIIGVITKREMGVAYMKVAGKNKEEKAVDWEFVLVFPKTINMDGVTVGKSLTLRGTFATTGIGTSTIDVNVVVGQ